MKSLWFLVFTVVVTGCKGETVEASTPDSAPDTAALDTTVSDDSTAADSTGLDASADAGSPMDTSTSDAASAETTDAAACSLPGNLLPNGDFALGTSGWTPEKAKIEIIEGPCGGKAARIFESTSYGGIGRAFDRTLTKGTTVRIQAWFKKSGVSSGSAPNFLVRTLYMSDAGGEEPGNEVAVLVDPTSVWTKGEASVVLTRDAVRISAYVLSRSPDADEFAVGGLSITAE